MAAGQTVLYVTARAVFELTGEGMCLCEVAPGVDLQRDVLERMAFAPGIAAKLRLMSSDYFRVEL